MRDKVILAYSGGLDTSCCVKWLQDKYNLDVICFSAFIGEVPDKKKLEKRALRAGAKKAIISDLKEEFARDFLTPGLWAHARYEGQYPLATSFGRPLIAQHMVEIAHQENAKYVAHGCTGKGNDQVRLEVGVRALDPSLKIIAPLREWEFKSREEEIDYAKKHHIPIDVTKKSVYSIDKNIWGIAIEGGVLEDPEKAPPEGAFVLTQGLDNVPKSPATVKIGFQKGLPVTLNGKKMGLVALIDVLNDLAGKYGVGRIDMIENRLVGIKSREVYEAPAATVLLKAHEELESLVMDRDYLHYKRVLSEKYSELVYYGLWFTSLRESLDVFFQANQHLITGEVTFKLDKGHAIVQGRKSPNSIYSEALATYTASDRFDHKAADGFLKLWGLPYEGTAKGQLKKKKKS